MMHTRPALAAMASGIESALKWVAYTLPLYLSAAFAAPGLFGLGRFAFGVWETGVFPRMNPNAIASLTFFVSLLMLATACIFVRQHIAKRWPEVLTT